MDKSILTTSETAQLLGVSVRTAQLLIESGSLVSWKTPGGHRRVYRDDVVALMSKDKSHAHSSARIVIIASPARLRSYETLVSKIPGCVTDAFNDAYSLSLALGLHPPRVVIVDLEEKNKEREAFLRSLASNVEFADVKIVAVAKRNIAALQEIDRKRLIRVADVKLLPDAVRKLIQDSPKMAAPFEANLSFPIAGNENQRLVALERSGLVDTAPETIFDRLTWLASHTLKTPIALFTMLTSSRQWFKSRQGLDMLETPRSWAFCNYTILQRNVFAVGNLARSEEFANNPAVAGGSKFRFYAGAPVLDADGFALGSLCVIDYKPRTLNRDQEEILRSLAQFTSEAVQLREARRDLRNTPAISRH